MAFTVRCICQKFAGFNDSSFNSTIAGIADSNLDSVVITHYNSTGPYGYVAIQARVLRSDKEDCYAYMHYRIQTVLASTEIPSDQIQYVVEY